MHNGFHCGLALPERRRGFELLAREPLARQLQEYLAVALQAFAGKLAEGCLQLFADAREGEIALDGRALLGLHPNPQQFQLDTQCMFALGTPDERRKDPEHAAA